MPNDNANDTSPPIPRDWRAVIVAAVGITAIGIVAILGIVLLPGPIGTGKTDNASAAIGGIVGAAVAAIGTVVSAYFGIKAANMAREATQDAADKQQDTNARAQVTLAEVAGAGDPARVESALDRAQTRLRQLNLM